MNPTETRICAALSSLESDFFSALQSGSEAILSFNAAWVTFTTQVQACADQLQQDTTTKIYSFASIANIIASTVIDIRIAGDDIHSQLREDMTHLIREEFRNLTINDGTPSPGIRANAAYIPLVSDWLLKNLHNPYPTRETRLEISKSTNSVLRDIDAWFVDARKRIGWNQLRKEHFPKRGDLIKAATHFFKPTQSTIVTSKWKRSTLAADLYNDFANQFVQMQECACELYSGKLVPSKFATELEKAECSTERNAEERGRLNHRVDQRSSYPSPEYSPGWTTRSLSPPLLSPAPLNASLHGEKNTRKRKRSMSPADTLSDVDQFEQPVSLAVKRSRFNAAESLPSPAVSVDDTFSEESTSDALVSVPLVIPDQPSGKRKRTLSDDGDRIQKRPHVIPPTQSIHFSDPIRPAERLTAMNLEDLLVDVFGPNNEYAFGAAPATSPSFDEINQFGVEFQYDFPYDMPDDGLDYNETASPGDTPELENVALPQPQLTSLSNVNNVAAPDVENVTPNYDIPLPWGGLDMPSAEPGTEFWLAEQALTNSASMLSSGWPNDCTPIGFESLSAQTFWPPLGDLSNNAIDYCNLSTPSPGTLFSNPAPTKTPEQLLYDDKYQKINQLQHMLAQVEALRSELSL